MAKHLVKFITAYPMGFVPHWMPEGYVPESRIENDVLVFVDELPKIGDIQEIEGDRWTVIDLCLYTPTEASKSQTESFCVAVCTQDGKEYSRSNWHDSDPHILYIPILLSGDLPVADDDERVTLWGLVSDVKNIDAAFYPNWETQFIQWFELSPAEPYKSAQYDQVALCWCEQVELAIAA